MFTVKERRLGKREIQNVHFEYKKRTRRFNVGTKAGTERIRILKKENLKLAL